MDKKGRKRKEGTKENRIPLPPSLSLPLALSCFLPRDCEAAHLNGQLIHGGNGLLAPAVRRKTGEEGNGTFFRHGSQIKHLLARARERASPPPPSLFCFASLSLSLSPFGSGGHHLRHRRRGRRLRGRRLITMTRPLKREMRG